MSESGQFSDDYSDDGHEDHYDEDDDVYADEYSLGEYEDDEEQYYNDTDEYDEETDDDHQSEDYSDDEGPEIVYSRIPPMNYPPDKYMLKTCEAGKLKRRGWDVMAMIISLSVALLLGYFSVI